jgi:hypothetical protein
MDHPTTDGTTIDVDHFKVNDSIYINENGQTYHGTVKEVAFKVNKKDPTKSEWKYHIHFTGWSARHDRWLTRDNIHPESEKMRILAEESKTRFEEAAMKRKQKKAESSRKNKNTKQVRGIESKAMTQEAYTSPNASKKRRRRQEPESSVLSDQRNHRSPEEDDMNSDISIDDYCSLPFTLMTILKDDEMELTRSGFYSECGYDPVTRTDPPARKVHILPAKVTVDNILTQFTNISSKDLQDEKARQLYKMFSNDMSTFFDSILSKFLLYPSEREQYLHLIRNYSIPPSKIYSGLKSIADLSNMESDMKSYLNTNGGKMIAELIKFMQKYSNSCLKTRYRFPTPAEYTSEEKSFIKMTTTESNKSI